MKAKIKMILGLLILAAAAFFYGHIHKVHTIYNTEANPDYYKETGILTDYGARQEFVTQEKHLDGVRVMCKIFGGSPGEETEIFCELKDAETGEVVSSGGISAKKVKNDKFFDIPFDRVEDTRGKRYEIFLYSNLKFGEEHTQGVGFYFDESENTQGTPIVVAEGEVQEYESGTMILKTITDRFDLETSVVFFLFALYVALFMKYLYNLFK